MSKWAGCREVLFLIFGGQYEYMEMPQLGCPGLYGLVPEPEGDVIDQGWVFYRIIAIADAVDIPLFGLNPTVFFNIESLESDPAGSAHALFGAGGFTIRQNRSPQAPVEAYVFD